MKRLNNIFQFIKDPPNKFLRFEEKRFLYNHGAGTVVIAHFLNKSKQPSQMECRVIWDEQPYSKEWELKYGRKKEVN